MKLNKIGQLVGHLKVGAKGLVTIRLILVIKKFHRQFYSKVIGKGNAKLNRKTI